jgi:aspartate-semialdehyde dehydrogenase
LRLPHHFHYGHSEAINIETKTKITAAEATEILSKASGVTVMDKREDGGYATPFVEATNHDDTFVSRIREDISCEKGLNLWVVSDNIRKGAALNSIQIAEILIKEYL